VVPQRIEVGIVLHPAEILVTEGERLLFEDLVLVLAK